ncbi:MAG: BTAD domain-containing putative transcriptional regulator [Acidimicrobiales bacterium]
MVSVSLFGQLAIRSEDRVLGPASFSGVKPKALLEILLLAGGRPVSKETLADALWPEARPKNVAATLETYVSVIRSRMFEDRLQARRVIVTSAGAYRIDSNHIDLDVTRFDELLTRAEQAPPRQRRPLWVEAVGLAGGALLEDEPHAAWAAAARELYQTRVLRTHLLIAEEALTTDEPLLALRHGEAALLVNPVAEEAHRMVMLANHAMGYGEAARQAFLRCRDVLDLELDVDPTSETTQLAAAIDAGVPAAELIEAATRGVALAPTVEVRDRRDPTRRMPFVGRASELARLHACATASRWGLQSIVRLEGPPGFGRTALLEQFRAGLRVPAGRYAYLPEDRERPLPPLAGALTAALSGQDGQHDAHRYARSASLGLGADTREQLLAVLRDHAPMVLLLDDLHHADEDTIDTLVWLQAVAAELPVAIVISTRSGSSGEALQHRLVFADRITLTGLSVADCAEARSIDPGLVLATGGNPALLSDLWRWRRSGKSDRSPSLEDAIRRRVRGLGASLASLLQTASSCAERFTSEDLAMASERAPAEVADGLARLCAHELLETAGAAFCFSQPVVREVLRNTLAPPAQAPLLADAPLLATGSGGGSRAAGPASVGLDAPMVARAKAPPLAGSAIT